MTDRQRSTHPIARGSGPGRPAFTLIELLVVIGIISLLIGLAVVVGAQVMAGGKSRATADVVRTLDESLGAWQLNADSPLPKAVPVEDDRGREVQFLLIDGRPKGASRDDPAYPTIAFYTGLVMQDESIRAVFTQIDGAFLRPSAVPQWTDRSGSRESWAIEALVVRDAWGRPLRLVHPAFHGGHGDYWDPIARWMQPREFLEGKLVPRGPGLYQQVDFSRSYLPFADDQSRTVRDIGDADEGMCIGGAPYFYSPGDDGDPGTRRDNVYSTVPRFPIETKGFE